jgi:formylglycine-generating enzyme required for sulfatase activity
MRPTPARLRTAPRGECEKAVVRGGAWGLAPEDARSARREGDNKELRSGRRGFRVARDLP